MFNRIRISTSLFLLLMTFCVLQLASSGLSYSAFRSDNHNLDIITLGSQQRDSLSLSWVSLLQARNTLNRAGTRAALKLPQEQVNELMSSARSSLQKADLYFNQFMAVERSSEQQSQQTATTKASYERLRGTLRELIGFLEKGELQAFMDQPTQKTQDLFEADFVQYLQLVNGDISEARDANQFSFTLAGLMLAGAVLMLIVVTGSAMWWLRTMLVQPLNQIRSHFERIAAGDLATPIQVYGRNEISMLFASLQRTQQSLIGTVGAVRDGAESILIGLQEISEGNNDLSSRTEQQAASLEETAASMEQLTATVIQNADNARQASQL
ncbi:Tar ligand binding domain-containing protein, partial [Serratia marcescens]|uniref:Tar ligand binding domain-containing protein n=2 Tax=Serratia TaxID=613 RepID=UPI0034E1CE7D